MFIFPDECVYGETEDLYFSDEPSINDFDKTYLKVLKEFVQEYNNSKNEEERDIIFENFAKKYTMIPDLWRLQASRLEKREKTNALKFFNQCFSHFYYKNLYLCAIPFLNDITFSDFPQMPFLYCYDMNHTIVFQIGERIPCSLQFMLTLPLKNLKLFYSDFDKLSDNPLSEEIKNKYNEAILHVNECNFENYKNSPRQWMENLFKFGGEKFAIQTIESVITENYWNKLLWKDYIQIMKGKNVKIMLNIFDRYTKLFLDDREMQIQYKKEKDECVKNMSDYNELPELRFYLFDVNPQLNYKPFIMPGNYQQKPQNFNLPKPIINYINNHANGNQRMKLIKLCKYFAIVSPSIVCHQLLVKSNVKVSGFYQQSLKCNYPYIKKTNFPKKFHITNNLLFDTAEQNFRELHKIIPKIYKCDARFIKIRFQDLTWPDVVFIFNPKTVEKLEFVENEVVKDNGDIASIYEYLILVPNAYYIYVSTNEDSITVAEEKVRNLPRNVQIEYLSVSPLFRGL